MSLVNALLCCFVFCRRIVRTVKQKYFEPIPIIMPSTLPPLPPIVSLYEAKQAKTFLQQSLIFFYCLPQQRSHRWMTSSLPVSGSHIHLLPHRQETCVERCFVLRAYLRYNLQQQCCKATNKWKFFDIEVKTGAILCKSGCSLH